MNQPSSKRDTSRITRRQRTTSAVRRSTLELVRIYVASSAYSAAKETLEQLPTNGWDEEAHLLRAETLIGMGELTEATRVLGTVSIPRTERFERKGRVRPRHGQAASTPVRLAKKPASNRPMTRRQHLDLWRFLLQLRVLHRTARYDQVLQLGRAFLGTGAFADNTLLARVATVIAQSMMAVRRPSEARDLYEDVLDLYKRIHSKEGVADTLLGLANSHLLDCHWDEADALYQECRYRYEELGQSDKAIASMINLGILRAKRGDLTGGRFLLEQAQNRCDELGKSTRALSINLGLAMVLNRLGQYAAARERIRSVLAVARPSRKLREVGLALEFLGEGYLGEGRLEKAGRTLSLGLRIASKVSPRGDIVFEIRRRLADLARQTGNLENARVLANEADADARDYGDEFERAAIQRVLAEIDLDTGDLISSRRRCELAAEMLDRLGETIERAQVRSVLRELDQAEGIEIAKVPPLTQQTVSPLPTEERSNVRDLTCHREGDHLTKDDLRLARALGIVTRNRSLLQTLILAQKVAPLPVSILVFGEPGSGAERIARLVHEWSLRDGLYIPLHCSDAPARLLESEVFGSSTAPGGLLAASEGGTLFLDQVNELAPSVQNRLLSLYESGKAVTTRIVSVVRSNPKGRSTVGLHDGLKHHLGQVVLEIPPLRERPEDIPDQVELLLEQARRRYGKEIPTPPQSWIDECRCHDWPGNLAELRQVVENYVAGQRETAAE